MLSKETKMKDIKEIKTLLLKNKLYLVNKYNLKSIALFGSITRNDATEKSDVDILVEFEKPIGLEFVLLADELEKFLGVKVDLVTPNALKPKMFEYIKQELQYV
jgi:predicted nucleotidyltransferase